MWQSDAFHVSRSSLPRPIPSSAPLSERMSMSNGCVPMGHVRRPLRVTTVVVVRWSTVTGRVRRRGSRTILGLSAGVGCRWRGDAAVDDVAPNVGAASAGVGGADRSEALVVTLADQHDRQSRILNVWGLNTHLRSLPGSHVGLDAV